MSGTEMVKCPSCGQMTKANGFCMLCGASLKPPPAVKPPTAPPTPPVTAPPTPPSVVAPAPPQPTPPVTAPPTPPITTPPIPPTVVVPPPTPVEPTAPALILPTKPTASVVVIKSLTSPSSAKDIAEKNKLSLFPQVKRAMFGPRPEELIQVQSVDKSYENFIRVHGVYSIRYVKSNAYPVQIDANVVEVMCGGTSFKPVDRVVKVEVDERKVYKSELTIVYDNHGDERKLDLIPAAETEGQPASILSEAKIDIKRFGRLEETVFSMATNVLKLRICQVPDEVSRIEEERLDMPEFAHVFVPSYKATIRHVKTNETRVLQIDGATGKTQIIA